MTIKCKSWRDVLPIHPAAELFPMMSERDLRDLGADIKTRGLLEGVAILDGKLLDGRNRLDAMELVGINLVTVDGQLDWANIPHCNVQGVNPFDFVFSKNFHRRHLSLEQKANLVAEILFATPEKSNRAIAEITKVDHKTVAAIREKKVATGELPQLTKTIGKDGKARKTPTPPATMQKPTTDSDHVQATPANLIVPASDVIIAEYSMCLMGMIDEAAHRLDPGDCVTLLERMQSIINGLLVGAKQAAKNMREETPKVVERATERATDQSDDGIPEFLRRT